MWTEDSGSNPKEAEQLQMLESLGLTEYEAKSYLALVSFGVADANSICKSSGVPSSKIYQIMQKFQLLGLIETLHSKPERYRALEPSVGVRKLINYKEKEVVALKEISSLLEAQLSQVYPQNGSDDDGGSFSTITFGLKDYFQKQMIRLTLARNELKSYVESTCLMGAHIYGRDVKPAVYRHVIKNDIYSRWVFGIRNKRLLSELLKSVPKSDNIDIRITDKIHPPFHIIDCKSVIMVINSPLFNDEKIASIYVNNKKLCDELGKAYEAIWQEAKEPGRFGLEV